MPGAPETSEERIATFTVWLPVLFSMVYTLPVCALSAHDLEIAPSDMRLFRITCVVSVILAFNVVRLSSQARSPLVLRLMAASWFASSLILVSGGLISGGMSLRVGLCFLLSSFTPLARLDAASHTALPVKSTLLDDEANQEILRLH